MASDLAYALVILAGASVLTGSWLLFVVEPASAEKRLAGEAVAKGDPVLCGNISGREMREHCYKSLAVSLADKSLCDRIVDARGRDGCHADYGRLVCEKPFSRIGGVCCADDNNNGVCDASDTVTITPEAATTTTLRADASVCETVSEGQVTSCFLGLMNKTGDRSMCNRLQSRGYAAVCAKLLGLSPQEYTLPGDMSCIDTDGGADFDVRGFTNGTDYGHGAYFVDRCGFMAKVEETAHHSIIIYQCAGVGCYANEWSCKPDDEVHIMSKGCPEGCLLGVCGQGTSPQPIPAGFNDCADIPITEARENCYNDVKIASGYLIDCDGYPDQHKKDECFAYIATLLNSSSICDGIHDTKTQRACHIAWEISHQAEVGLATVNN